MATELAKAYVQIIPSAQGISGKIQQAIDPEAEPAGASFGGKLVGAAKKVLAAAAIGKAMKASILEGADLEQSLGGIETLFKDSADKVKAKFNWYNCNWFKRNSSFSFLSILSNNINFIVH